MHALPRWMWAWLLTLLLAAQAHAQALKPVPPLRARVTDEINMLTPDQRQRLDNVLADYEAKTGSQIAVLLVASTEPEAIEQYGIRVTDAWKLGRKGVDDGVLLLVARDNPKALRRLRIEAGRGVQGVLTDAQSKRILEDTIAPHFRQQDWYGGLVAGVGAIATLLNQEKFPAPQARPATPEPQNDGGAGILMSIFAIVVGVLVLRSVFRGRRTRLASWNTPGQTPRSDWNDATTGFIVGSILGSSGRQDDDARWRGGSGSFTGGSGSFTGGSDSGGSSFDGGGGSFDGGGASGDW